MREDYFEEVKEEYEEIRQEHYDSLKVKEETPPSESFSYCLCSINIDLIINRLNPKIYYVNQEGFKHKS